MNEALSEARRLGHAHTLAQVLNSACRPISTLREAQRYAEEAMALSIEHGFQHWLALANANLGWVLTILGRAQEGVALLKKGLSIDGATGAVLDRPWMLTGLAEAHARLGQSVEGLNCLTEAVQIIESTDLRIMENDLYRVRGDLLNSTGDWAAAEQSYPQALTIAQRQGAKFFELRAAMSMARLLARSGQAREGTRVSWSGLWLVY
jgi:tetratricopeptide (TPR) repeat protein